MFRKLTRSQNGQVAILFALVFTFMFILFAFVVDFGHLINTKINLQLAADTAAYAGAASQANTLNRMGMLNYRLRQDLKEFAMRVHVTHLRHNRKFPRGTAFINGPTKDPDVLPIICQQAHGYQSLSGRRYSDDTNLCRNASAETGGILPIVVPPVIASFDPFAIALQQQIIQIANEANAECAASAVDNQLLAQHLIDTYTRRSQFHANQIQTLADFMNQTGNGTIGDNDIHPIRRVVLETVKKNVALANRDDLRVEILAPRNNQYIQLERQNIRGSLFYLRLTVDGNGCVGIPDLINFDDMVAVVNKSPEIVTYLAVKVTARPKMLFMPEAWVDASFPLVEAYAVAKPFGSRIGPFPRADPLMPTARSPGKSITRLNFSVRPGDTHGIIDNKLMAFYDALHPFNQASRPDGNQQTGWPQPRSNNENFRLVLQAIHAPTIFDALFYPVFPNPDRTEDYLEPDYALAGYPDYLEAADTRGELLQLPRPTTPAYFALTGNQEEGWIRIDATNSANGAYGDYADEAPDSHAVTTAVGLPFITETNATQFGFATPQILHSSWAPRGRFGRIGYSVKLLSFDALMGGILIQNSAGAQSPFANQPQGDDNLQRIFH